MEDPYKGAARTPHNKWKGWQLKLHYGKGGSQSRSCYAPVLAGVAAADTGIFMGTNYGGAMGTELKPGPI